MKYLITTSPIAYIMIAITFQFEINTILLLAFTGASLYTSISYLLTNKKEKLFLKEEIQYFIDSFQNIRKPITLVHTPLQNICNNTCPENIRKELSLSIRNMGCLNEHLTKLMGLKHLHIQSQKPDIVEYELGSFLKDKLHSLQNHAKCKCIKLDIKSEFNYVSAWGDTSKVSPVIEKFITDAIDYVEPETKLTIFISLCRGYWEIKIADTEYGKLAEIYNRKKSWIHKQKTEVECTFSKSPLFKKLLDLCNGKIIINRIEHTISLRFPLGTPCAENAKQAVAPRIMQSPEDEKIDILFQETSCKRCSDKPVVVLVDGNDDFRLYLESCLSENYTIKSFSNGTQALIDIKEEYPDLVICDTELHGMSGDELSSRLKTSCETSIIPIILYGSHIDIDQRNKRRASLADTFLYMPLHIEDLKIEMSVLINNYRFLRKSFVQKIFGEDFLKINVREMLEDDNRQLINKVKKCVLDNLDKETLTVKYIAKEIGMSRTNFFNHWKNLTGKAPVEFINRVRMEKAHELLESGEYRIGEIPEAIGLKDVKNFRIKYKKHFGIPPRETLRKI